MLFQRGKHKRATRNNKQKHDNSHKHYQLPQEFLNNKAAYQLYSTVMNDLLQEFYSSDRNANIVFSPFSVLMILAIMEEATCGATRSEIVRLLGGDPVSEDMKRWLKELQNVLSESGAFMSSNAVCVRKDIYDKIVPGYEEKLIMMFEGKLFSSDDMAVDVNNWVNDKTHGLIREVVDDSVKDMLACLMNAVAFEAKWQRKYKWEDLDYGEFHNSDGTVEEISAMYSKEHMYLEDSYFTGFAKPYRDVDYSFVALLPKADTCLILDEAIKHLDISWLFKNRNAEAVEVMIPEYKYEYHECLNDSFMRLGIIKAFSEDADFSSMVDAWMMIEEVTHKAFIQVDRNGTKASATTVAMETKGAPPQEDYKVVELDRPFVYAIVHNETAIPVFVGIVNHLDMGDYTFEEEWE